MRAGGFFFQIRVVPGSEELFGVGDILAEQFAGEFAERLVGRAVAVVGYVVFEVMCSSSALG